MTEHINSGKKEVILRWSQGEKMMKQKLEYMHYNPVKRGYVDEPIHWRYSSARNYAEEEGSLLEILYGVVTQSVQDCIPTQSAGTSIPKQKTQE